MHHIKITICLTISMGVVDYKAGGKSIRIVGLWGYSKAT